MRDRQEFEKTVLPNGITVYTYQLDSPIVSLELQLPVGAAHSHAGNGFLPGSVHFLEHLQLIRSQKFPHPHQLNKELGLRGGHFNGSTFRSKTTYSIDAPASELDFVCGALIDRVYHPMFHPDELEPERTVVINEREREKFYPGRNKASQYYNTEFMFDMPYPLEQLYGSNDSLAAITVQRLEEMNYIITRSQGTVAIAVGNGDFSALKEQLAAIRTMPGLLNKKMNDTVWKNRHFRLVSFDTVTRPTLEVAWIHPRVTPAERTGISFILSLLTNHVHGTLFQELRHRRGWVYRLDNYIASHKQTMFGMTFPLNTIRQMDFIRQHLQERIWTAIGDQVTVEHEIRRRLNNQVYNYQTAASIMAQASRDLIGSKKIFTEHEWQEAINAMADPQWREEIVNRFFRPEDMGEIGFTSA